MFFAIVGLLSAQQVSKINKATQKTEVSDISQAELQAKVELLKKKIALRKNNSRVIKSRWYNAADATAAILGQGVGVATSNNIFPDTTLLVDYGSSVAGAWIHSVAECVDPMSAWYQSATELTIDKYTPYTVDSIAMYCFYRRKTNASIVDTLLIQVRPSTTAYRFWANNAHFTDNYNVDTCAYRPVPYDLGKTYSTDADVITIKLPLTEAMLADTMDNGMSHFKVAPRAVLNIPAGEQVIVSFGFIPGYTWVANVDFIKDKNSFRFISSEENGADTYPSYTKWDWTSSYIQDDDKLYDPAPKSYSSHLGYMNTYGYEHHWVEVLLTANDGTSINNNTSSTLKVSQNRPNPFNGNTSIAYNLVKSSNVNVTIYNVAGAKVMDLNQGTQSAGSHNLNINGSSLQAGVYFYTFTADNNSVTKKMIVY